MYRDKDKLAINVAKLYYRSDYSQQKIAQELGVSRPSISRLLQYAKDKGYVNIQIVDPVEDMSHMEQRLKDKLHLKDVKIASSTINDEEEIKKYIGITAARYLDSIIKDGDIILLHDSTQDNLDAACRIIDALQPRGYDFVTVEELFRLRGVTPRNGVIYKRVPPAADPQAYDENRLESHWAWPAISLMEDTGIMTGDEEGWHPNRRLTRAAAAVVLWRAAGEPQARRRADFLDVPKSAWYAEAVAWAEEAGVIKGTGAGRFSPAAPVTRQQLYVMVDRLLDRGSVSVGTGEVRSFEDSFRISGWAREAVERIEALGFTSRNDRELFRPQDPATRAEAAELVAWYLGVR